MELLGGAGDEAREGVVAAAESEEAPMTFKFFTAKEFTPISPMCRPR